MSERELLPCPFCGGDPVLLTTVADDDYVREWVVRCDVCAVEQSDEYRADAAAAWNRRSPSRQSILEEAAKVALSLGDHIAADTLDKHDHAYKSALIGAAEAILALSHGKAPDKEGEAG